MTWWTRQHELWLVSVVASIVVYAAVAIAVPLACLRIRADYFVAPGPPRSALARVGRAALGTVLLASGVAMLFLPGPGILTMVLGLSIIDGGLAKRALAWLVSRPRVFAAVNHAREKRGRPPLVHPNG